MNFLVFSTFAMSLVVLGLVILPGLLISKTIFSSKANSFYLLVGTLSFGVVFLNFLLYIAMALEAIVGVQAVLVGSRVVPVVSLVVCLVLLRKRKVEIAFSRPSSLRFFIYLLALAYGIWSLYRVPWTMDNCLRWLIAHLNGDLKPVTSSGGSPGFLALSYFTTSYTFPWFPVISASAPVKVFLSPLCMFVLFSLRDRCSWIKIPEVFTILMFLTCVFSFFGLFGLMETAKESVYGLAFLFLFISHFFQVEEKVSNDWQWSSAACLAASVSMGTLSLPYAAMLFLILPFYFPVQIGWVFKIVLLAAGPVWLSFCAFTKIDPSILAGGLFCLVIVVYCLSRKFPTWHIDVSKFDSRWVSSLIVGFSLLLVYQVLPTKFHVGYMPFDGIMTLKTYFFGFDHNRAKLVTVFSFFGALYALYKGRKCIGTQLLLVFPFFTLACSASLVWIPDSLRPIPRQLVWDLTKDVSQWLMPYFEAFFCIAILSMLFQRLLGLLRINGWQLLTLKGIFVVGFFAVNVKQMGFEKFIYVYRFDRPAQFSFHSGNENPYLYSVVKGVWPRVESPYWSPLSNFTKPKTLGVCREDLDGSMPDIKLYGIDYVVIDTLELNFHSKGIEFLLCQRKSVEAISGSLAFMELENVTPAISLYKILESN